MTTAPDPEQQWWTTTDIAPYLGVQLGTVSSYRNRGQMPPPERVIGRSPVWAPADIIAWHEARPRPGVGGRPEQDVPNMGGPDSASTYLVVSTGAPTRAAAEELARAAIESHCAVSGQIAGPITSASLDEGVFTTIEEWRLSFISSSDHYDELEALIRNHSESQAPRITAQSLLAVSSENSR